MKFDFKTNQKVIDKGQQQSKFFFWSCFKIGVGTMELKHACGWFTVQKAVPMYVPLDYGNIQW